jgi:3-phosphoshikimate 1-carboxyvinyltransferase
VVHESIPTRDHSEIALREFGATVEFRPKYARIEGPARLAARTLTVPGDISSAAFFLAAALIVPEADIVIEGVGLNPARAVLLDYLKSIGARIEIQNFEHLGGEPVADLRVRTSTITAGLLEGATTAALIDEVPVLAVLAAKKGGLRVKDAAEMRVKETDRIATVVENFRRLGLEIEPRHDGFDVPGAQTFRPAAFDSFGDHRIAMAFAVAALAAEDACTIENAEAASVSFPEFYQTLARLRN